MLLVLVVIGIAFPVFSTFIALSDQQQLVLSDLAGVSGATIAFLLAVRATARTEGRVRLSWLLLSSGIGLWALGEFTWLWLELVEGREVPFPSIADAFYVPAYLALFAGVLSLSSVANRWSRARALMDALLFTFAAAIPIWRHVLLPLVEAPGADRVEQALAVFYPVGDLILLLALGILMSRQFPFCRPSMYVLALGIGATLMADVGFAVLSESDAYQAGSFVDFLWFGGFLFMGGAALMDSQRSYEEENQHDVAPWQNLIPVLSLIPLAFWFVYAAYSSQLDDAITPLLLGVYGLCLAGRQVVALFDVRSVHGDLEHTHRQLEGLFKQREEALRFEASLARRDPLTGQLNRQGLIEELNQILATGEPLAITVADLDGLKAINDEYGHKAGDQVLAAFAEFAAHIPNTTVGRYGGDEFVLATRNPDPLQLGLLLDNIRIALTEYVGRALGSAATCSVSFGVANFPAETLDLNDLLQRADDRMYEEKRQKGSARLRDLFRKASESIPAGNEVHPRSSDPQINTDSLQRALVDGEFEVDYQPIVAFATSELAGFEALVRWNHPEMGRLAPDAFVAKAERSAVIHRLGGLVLSKACEEAAKWIAPSRSGSNLFITVNVSPRQVRRAFVQEVFSSLEVSGLSPNALVLEITEGAVLSNLHHSLELLGLIQNMGVRIALDDFGVGYSSINYLRSFHFDMVKLDTSFTRGIISGGREASMASGLLEMAHGLGAQIVVEGVETASDLEALQGLDIDYAQGFHFGRPKAIAVQHVENGASLFEPAA